MQTRPLPYVGIRNRGVYSWDGRNGALRWDSDGFGKSFIDVPGRIPLLRDDPEPAFLPPGDINEGAALNFGHNLISSSGTATDAHILRCSIGLGLFRRINGRLGLARFFLFAS